MVIRDAIISGINRRIVPGDDLISKSVYHFTMDEGQYALSGARRASSVDNAYFGSRQYDNVMNVSGVDFWISAWVRPYQELSGGQGIISRWDNAINGRQYLIYWGGNNYQLYLGNNNGASSQVFNFSGAGENNPPIWNFLFAGYDTVNERVVLSTGDIISILETSDTSGGGKLVFSYNTPVYNNTTTPLQIGARTGTVLQPFEGDISLVGFGKPPGGLASVEEQLITSLYNKGRGKRYEEFTKNELSLFGLQSGVGLYYHLDELNNNDDAYDITDNVNLQPFNTPEPVKGIHGVQRQDLAGGILSQGGPYSANSGSPIIFGGHSATFSSIESGEIRIPQTYGLFDSPDKMSISFWIIQDSLTTGANVIGQWDDKNSFIRPINERRWKVETSGEDFVMRIATVATGDAVEKIALSNSSNWPTNTVLHNVFVYDGKQSANADKLKVFINTTGIPLEFPSGDLPSALNNSNPNLVFGNVLNSPRIDIDEVTIFNTDLTSGQISYLYNDGTGLNWNFTPSGMHINTALTDIVNEGIRGRAHILDTFQTTSGNPSSGHMTSPSNEKITFDIYSALGRDELGYVFTMDDRYSGSGLLIDVLWMKYDEVGGLSTKTFEAAIRNLRHDFENINQGSGVHYNYVGAEDTSALGTGVTHRTTITMLPGTGIDYVKAGDTALLKLRVHDDSIKHAVIAIDIREDV